MREKATEALTLAACSFTGLVVFALSAGIAVGIIWLVDQVRLVLP